MKLIALRSFANVPSLGLLELDEKGKPVKSLVDGVKHRDHIHKGAIFEIGKGDDLKSMAKSERPQAQAIAALIVSGSAGGANNPELVARVKAELAEDSKREANAAKRAEQLHNAQAGLAVLEMLQQLQASASVGAKK